MRTILDIFRLTPYPKLDYIYVGYLKIVFINVKSIKDLLVWITFYKATNSVLYIYQNSLDIYMLDDIISLISS
mgnify:CR=1 FL=1